MTGAGKRGRRTTAARTERSSSAPNIFDCSADRMWLLAVDGAVEHMNPPARLLAGRDARDDENWRDLWPGDSRFAVDRALKTAAAGQVANFRTFIPVESRYWETAISPVKTADGVVDRLLAVSRDVTREVETQAFLRSVVEILPIGLTVKSASDGRYALVNRAGELAIGANAEDLVGRTDFDRLPYADAERIARLERSVAADGGPHVVEETLAQENGQGARHFSVTRVATYDDVGPRHLITIHKDVTDQRSSAAALEAALKEAQSASQAKSTFLANMSHEVRTPLNGVLASAELLGAYPMPTACAELVRMIRASGRALERLLGGVLDVAAGEGGGLSIACGPFELDELIQSVAITAAERAQAKGIGFRAETPPEAAGHFSGDRLRIAQVLEHLVDNAVKFTSGGEVAVVVEALADDRFRFEVRDTGVGFDIAQRDRIFASFTQLDGSATRDFGGSGLGLTVARELAARMGGMLDCTSAPGAGSTFWFELPLPRHVVALPRRAQPEPGSAAKLSVLLADDHPNNRKIVEVMLSDVADIVSVENGREALDAFLASRPDIVLMDMQMPVMGGLEAVQAIRRLERGHKRPPTPIIMLTGNALPEHVHAACSAGADRHLAKPISAPALLGAIHDCLQAVGADTLSEDAV